MRNWQKTVNSNVIATTIIELLEKQNDSERIRFNCGKAGNELKV